MRVPRNHTFFGYLHFRKPPFGIIYIVTTVLTSLSEDAADASEFALLLGLSKKKKKKSCSEKQMGGSQKNGGLMTIVMSNELVISSYQQLNGGL